MKGFEPSASRFQGEHSTQAELHTDILDAPRGFEPRSSDSKSDILPLDDGATTVLMSLILPLQASAVTPHAVSVC